MRRTFQAQVVAAFLSVAAVLAADSRLFAADSNPPAKAKPELTPRMPGPGANPFAPPGPRNPNRPGLAAAMMSPQNAAAAVEKLRALGTQIGRALDVAVRLLSGNELDFVSRNRTELLSGNAPKLLSGNSPKLLSGNSPKLLSGNAPKLLSDNETPILSGNSFSMFSNIKIEIHVYNNNNGNNNNVTGNTAQPRQPPTGPGAAAYPFLTPSPALQPLPAPRPDARPRPSPTQPQKQNDSSDRRMS